MYIIVIVNDRISYKLAKELSKEGHKICILNYENTSIQEAKNPLNIQYNQTKDLDCEQLFKAGIENADALFAYTTDDNLNLSISIIAKKLFNLPRIISRLNNPSKGKIYDKLNIAYINMEDEEIQESKNILFKK
jgi:trk system potassium uptake protein TrkA